MTLALREVEQRALPPDGHPTILVIDRDDAARESLAADLSVEGFDVVTAADGTEGLALVVSVQPSLVVLDLYPADRSGLTIFNQIAAVSSVPVIMVTAKDDEIDAVQSLDAGAADHVTKPFRQRELTARVRAVLRRVAQQQPSPADAEAEAAPLSPVATLDTAADSAIQIDIPLRETVVRGEPVELSRKEFDLLALLVSESGHVITRSQCMERLWSERQLGDSRTLDTHIKRLRKKIELDPANPRHIITVRGIGYRFRP